MRINSFLFVALLAFTFQASISQAQEATDQVSNNQRLSLKRKVAVARFTNSTNYGKALLSPGETDPRTVQATDALMSRLTEAGTFILFDNEVAAKLANASAEAGTNGVDALIVGSITELGRRAEGKAGFLNSNVRQVAYAKVDIRLVDAKSGISFFSTSGTGNAYIETKEVAGFGAVSSYDSSLIDKAISTAIADTTTNIIQKLNNRAWSTDILSVQGNTAYISGGSYQGLKIGKTFAVEKSGPKVKSAQTGGFITLPGQKVAEITINSFFGDSELDEGSVANITQGQLSPQEVNSYIVKEIK